MKSALHAILPSLVLACAFTASAKAHAAPPKPDEGLEHGNRRLPAPTQPEARPLKVGKSPDGRPNIKLDRLEFPTDLPESSALKKHLIRVLTREVRRVEWGAGRENRIEYRYSVTELSLKREGDVLHVTCTSVGKLPGGRTAKSHLSFGGAARERYKLLKKVLEIVARGVVSRLAELERERRGLAH